MLLSHLEPALAPVQERRRALESDRGRIHDVLADGARRARVEAKATMDRVREAMHLTPRSHA
jgi:hypothetical protein